MSLLRLSLAQACSHRFPWLESGTMEMPDLLPFPPRSLTWASSLTSHFFVPALLEVAASGLFSQKSLSQDCSCGGRCLMLALGEVTASWNYLL